MTEYISRQAAIDALDCINGVEEVLRSLPSVQPEIIRCKDCKFYTPMNRATRNRNMIFRMFLFGGMTSARVAKKTITFLKDMSCVESGADCLKMQIFQTLSRLSGNRLNPTRRKKHDPD